MAATLDELYDEMKQCKACNLREACTQVVTHEGQTVNPIVMIIGEAPTSEDDESDRPFVGPGGQLLRQFLRENKLNPNNTLISYTLHCRPPGNKFPTSSKNPKMCVSMWMQRELELAKPKLLLLVGGQAMKYVAGVEGIMAMRGTWISARGIRAMPTYHPSYVLRKEGEGDPGPLHCFESDIREVSIEAHEIENARLKV